MSLKKALAGVALLAMTAAAAPLAAQNVERPLAPVQTTGGEVAGQILPSGVKAWLGVPFAKPPVQNLRWQPPQPISWNGVWNADRKGAECIQVLRPHDINHYFGEEATSEDCLYMNIWAPAAAKPGAKLPVIVFMYGGGYTIGSSGMANYGGEGWPRRGAVFVNFNYRVGALRLHGPPRADRASRAAIPATTAYLDQIAALKWVSANIAKFGGDPDKVRDHGPVGGRRLGRAADLQPAGQGPVPRRGDVQRLQLTARPAGTTAGRGREDRPAIQKRLGAPNLAAMRNMPADRILAISPRASSALSVQGVRVGGPIIDGYFLPERPRPIARGRRKSIACRSSPASTSDESMPA